MKLTPEQVEQNMEAYRAKMLDSKTRIEVVLDDNGWHDKTSESFNPNSIYRLKPKPTHGWEVSMTLRDWFAGQSLSAIVLPGKSAKDFAELAYDMADAMLAARKEQV